MLGKARAKPDGIRTSVLLLPTLLRSDWQHSSSRLPITSNDARWTSSPSGRYCFSVFPPQESQRLEQLHNIRAHYGRVRPKLCIGRIGAILEQLYPSARLHTIFNSSIGAAHSSSQRPSIWIGDTPPPGCRSEQSDARWISSPSGRCLFLAPHISGSFQPRQVDCAARFRRQPRTRHCAEACTACMGAMQHCLCNFCSKRLYSRASDDGQQERLSAGTRP